MPANRVTSETPWHIVFLIDDSVSMAHNGGSDAVNEAMQVMLDELSLKTKGLKPYFSISIVSFGSDFRDIAIAKSEQEIDEDAVTLFKGTSGTTNAAAALARAQAILEGHPGRATDFDPFVFFLSDGQPDNEPLALAAGDQLKSCALPAGKPVIVTIGFGDAKDSFMQALASNPEMYIRLQNAKQIVTFLPAIGTIVNDVSGGTPAVMQQIAQTSAHGAVGVPPKII